MTKHVTRPITTLFLVAAAYDGLLGLVFLVAPGAVFRGTGVPEPNHLAYVQFPAALLLIFAAMFTAVARDPRGHRDLIVYGILLKIAYCSLAFWYWFTAGIPGLWKPFAVIDAVMGAIFAWSYAELGKSAVVNSVSTASAPKHGHD
jgi:hypothetical protein